MGGHKERTGCIECPDIPVFRPTEAEWRNPLGYLASVRRQAELAGMAKIVPPTKWEPSHTFDRASLKFKTTSQCIHELQVKDTVTEAKQFWAMFNAFQESTGGGKGRKKPLFAGQEIDLYRLYRIIRKRGGYEEICNRKRWKDIVVAMEIEDKGSNAAYTLKHLYGKLLKPFEEHCVTRNRGGADLLADAIETEILGTKTVTGVKRSREQDLDPTEVGPVAEALLDLVPESPANGESSHGLAEAPKTSEPTGKDSSKSKKTKKKKGQKVEAKDVEKDVELVSAMVCESCRGGHYEDKIILCDRCDRGWHLFCLTPPMKKVPKGDWVCPICDAIRKGGDKKTQLPGASEMLSLQEFEKRARSFDKVWYNSAKPSSISYKEREREYWAIVCGGDDMAEVLIGNDPSVTLQRTEAQKKKGLASVTRWKTAESQNLAEYCDPPKEGQTSMLHTGNLQFGMTFSSTTWKVEEQLLYSLTYLHEGSERQWYCIPAYASSMFESLVQAMHADYMISMEWETPLGANLMVSPEALIERGVPVYRCTQEEGTLVVSFPNSYHCSVAMGLQISESILMMPPDWLRFSSQATSLYRNHRFPPLFSVEQMIMNAYNNLSKLGDETKYWISLELSRLVEEESMMRYKLWSDGLRRFRQIGDVDTESPKPKDKKNESQDSTIKECCVCRNKVVFAMIECPCSPKKVACLHHGQHLCRCKVARRRLAWRYSLDELYRIKQEFLDSVPPSARDRICTDEAEEEDNMAAAIEKAVLAARDAEDHMRETFMSTIIDNNSTKKKKKRKDRTDTAAADVKMESAETMGDNNCMKEIASLQPGAPMTFVTECGYVQGPVRQFSHMDLHPEDFESVDVWRAMYEKNCRKWVSDAKLALQRGRDRAFDLPDLVDEGSEYLWGDISGDLKEEIVALRPQLERADEFVERIFAAQNGKPQLEDVEKIIATDPLPLNSPPGLDDLKKSVADAKLWISKHGSVATDLTIDPPLDSKQLDAMATEAGRIPITIPEAKTLRERLSSIKKVAEAVRIALPKNRETGRRKNNEDPITLEFLENLHKESTDAHIMMPEIVTLNEAMDKINDWRDRVEKALSERSTWKVYEQLIEEGKTMPCEMPDIERLLELQHRVYAWISEMYSLKAQNKPLKRLREFLAEGYNLPIAFDEIAEMEAYLQNFEWEDKAKKCVSSLATIEDLEFLLSCAPSGNDSVAHLLEGLQSKLQKAKAWTESAEMFAKNHGSSLPHIDEVKTLVAQGEDTQVKTDVLVSYSDKLAAAAKWIRRCQRCLSVKESPLVPPEVTRQRVPIVSGASHPCVRTKILWMAPETRDKLPSFSVIDSLIRDYDDLGMQMDEYEVLAVLHKKAIAWHEEADPILSQTDIFEDQIPLVEDIIEKGLRTGLKIAQVDNLESYLHAFVWKQTVDDILELTENPSSYPDYPLASLELLAELSNVGEKISSSKEEFKNLKRLVARGNRWLKEANAILRPEKPKIVSLQHAKELVSSGASLNIYFGGSDQERITSLISEYEKLSDALSLLLRGDNRPTVSHVKEIYQNLMMIPIESEPKETIHKVMKQIETMESSTMPSLGTTFSKIPLTQALSYLEATIDAAKEQKDKALQADHLDIESHYDDDEGVLFCLCQQSSVADSAMVACDYCSDWYHTSCIGFREGGLASLKSSTFLCPICAAVDDVNNPLSETIRSLKPVKLASRDKLVSILETCEQMPIISDIEIRVRRTLQKFDDWSNHAIAIAQRQRETLSSSANDSGFSESVFRQLIKSALAIEIDGFKFAEIFLQVLRVTKWRANAHAFMKQAQNPSAADEPRKPSMETLRGIYESSRVIGISAKDPVVNLIKIAWDEAVQWKALADSAIKEIKEARNCNNPRFYSIQSRVNDLIRSGKSLPIPPHDEIVILREYSVPYCLCREISDENSILIECEKCQEWYHFECVGLKTPKPQKSSTGELPLPDDFSFTCPICCIGLGKEYERLNKIPERCIQTYYAIKNDALPILEPLFGADIFKKKILRMYNSAAYQYVFSNGLATHEQASSTAENRKLLQQLQQVKKNHAPSADHRIQDPHIANGGLRYDSELDIE
ncbi:hypothetical protein M9435_001123 [Picochlorum sp. BPE23]|nr:hypothetical protein M9435_001123 [Picochlorum sp. BPE23]